MAKRTTPHKDRINPDIKWYKSISKSEKLTPFCPFADADKCNHYDESFGVINSPNSEFTQYPEDSKSTKFWQSPKVLYRNGERKGYKNLCPEIGYKYLDFFATNFYFFIEEKDRICRHNKLIMESVPNGQWRWYYDMIEPLHYSDCPQFSILQADPTVKEIKRSNIAKDFPKVPKAKKWEDVTITLLANDMIKIKTPKEEAKFTYHQIGLQDKRRGDRAGMLWGLLKVFAENNGFISSKNTPYDPKLPDTAKRLNNHMKKIFGIKESIYAGHYKKEKGYRTKIKFINQTF